MQEQEREQQQHEHVTNANVWQYGVSCSRIDGMREMKHNTTDAV